MICGIYEIVNKLTGMKYIGQSYNIKHRIANHFSHLRHNKHYNHHLQRSFNTHGEQMFTWSVLEECDRSKLAENEQKWILSNKRLFNHVIDVQHRQGESNPNFGTKNSLETKIKMSEGRSRKLKRHDVLQIAERLRQGFSHKEVAEEFGVLRTVVTRISNGTRWTNVTGGAIRPSRDENGNRIFSDEHRKRLGNNRRGHKHTDECKQLMREKAIARHSKKGG